MLSAKRCCVGFYVKGIRNSVMHWVAKSTVSWLTTTQYSELLKFMTILQPGIKSNIFYCHNGLVLMNAIATKDCKHNAMLRHSSPSVFIRGDVMLKTHDLYIYLST